MRRVPMLLVVSGIILLASWLRFEPARLPAPAEEALQAAASAITATSAEEEPVREGPPAHETRESPYPIAQIVRVVDGDTVVVDLSGTSTTLRLIGLDTPEVVDPRKPVQCFGVEASAHAKELLVGKSVGVAYDPSQGRLDKYGRTLAYLFLPDGTNFAERMIAEGYAHEYTYRFPYAYQSEFRAAEKKARDEKLGLWADAACAAESAR